MNFQELSNEKERLANLFSYKLPDLLEQPEFDNLVQLASNICETPIALITILDADNQWFKAKVGLEVSHTAKDISFCKHAINTPDEIFVIEDARQDERFKNNPLVIGDPRIVFYAGVPIVTNEGFALGTICVIDKETRQLDERQYELLRGLSKQVIRLFELKKTIKLLEEKEEAYEQTCNSMTKYLDSVGHDVKLAFRNIEISTELIGRLSEGNEEILGLLKNTNEESGRGAQLINEVLKIVKSEADRIADKKAAKIVED